MSDCSTNAWRVPEEREEGVVYWHGLGSDYSNARAFIVDDVRFERVRECEFVPDGIGDGKVWNACTSCGGYVSADYDAPRFCPHCGARVKEGGDD